MVSARNVEDAISDANPNKNRRSCSSLSACLLRVRPYLFNAEVTSGRAVVPSILTACKSLGLSPNALRMVGATCEVVVNVDTVMCLMEGFDTSSMTFVSSWEKPPCSSSFAALPV